MNKEDYKLANTDLLETRMEEFTHNLTRYLRAKGFDKEIKKQMDKIHKLISALVWLVFIIQIYMVIMIIRMLLGL
jgi:hypothetical protein